MCRILILEFLISAKADSAAPDAPGALRAPGAPKFRELLELRELQELRGLQELWELQELRELWELLELAVSPRRPSFNFGTWAISKSPLCRILILDLSIQVLIAEF